MSKKIIIKYAFLHAVGVAAYIALIAALVFNANKFFDEADNGPLNAVAFLLTFVISAAIMGVLVFGKPVLLYLDNFRKEAISLLFYTIGFLILIAIIVFLALLIL